MGQTAFWEFQIEGSLNLISALFTNLTVSLKWITVTFKIEMDQKHGTNCFLEVFDGEEFESDVHFVDRFAC